MAVSLRGGDENKIGRKMSLSYIKDSLVRRSTRQNGPRSHVCCCENLKDANGDIVDDAIKCCNSESSLDKNVDKCMCTAKSINDKHKPGILKSLKKKFQLKANIGTRSFKCKPKPTIKVLDSSSSSYSLSLSEESSSEGFTSTNSRKSRQSVPPPLRFARNVENDANIPLVNVSPQFDEDISSTRRISDVQTPCGFSSVSPQVIRNQANAHNLNNVTTMIKNNVETANRIPFARCNHEFSNDESMYSDTHNFMLDLHADGDNYDEVRHSTNELEPALPSPTARSLTCELFQLAKYGWYWGPITREEAEEKLFDLPDGAFLVRDSSADRYLLSVSFRSSGKTFHARIEYSHGMFSFYTIPGQEGFASIVELINHSMSYSKSAVFCYSRPRAPGWPAFPVRLAKPVSRFTQVRSLQYLCRFVIRQYVRVDNIQKLPLPNKLKCYIQEGHY